MVNIPLFIGFHTSQVVQDSSHQQYEALVLFFFTRNFLHRFRGSGFFDDSFFLRCPKHQVKISHSTGWYRRSCLFVGCRHLKFASPQVPQWSFSLQVLLIVVECFFLRCKENAAIHRVALQKMLACGNRMVVYLWVLVRVGLRFLDSHDWFLFWGLLFTSCF